MTTININNGIYSREAHRLVTAGYKFVTVCPRGEHKGDVLSKHRTWSAAERAARNRERTIVDLTTLTDVGAHE